jgi:hypothetical protein
MMTTGTPARESVSKGEMSSSSLVPGNVVLVEKIAAVDEKVRFNGQSVFHHGH